MKAVFFLFVTVLWKISVEKKYIACAVRANPRPTRVTLEDGKEIELALKGNAFDNWLEEEEGFPVVRVNGSFFYCSHQAEADGVLVPSDLKLGELRPTKGSILEKKQRPRRRPPPEPQLSDTAGAPPPAAPRDQSHLRTAAAPATTTAASLFHPPHPAGGGGGGAVASGDAGRRRRRRATAAATGLVRNLVVLLRFADHAQRPLPTATDVAHLWNAEGGHPDHAATTGASVRDYFLDQSYGLLDIQSTVVGWVDVPYTEAYYAAGDSGLGSGARLAALLRAGLEAADARVDLGPFDGDGDGALDMISFMHSGYGAEYGGWDPYGTWYSDRIWSHSGVMYPPFVGGGGGGGVSAEAYHLESALYGLGGGALATISVAAHESAHFLGLPDLYDTDMSSSGIDVWGLMGNSWGWDGTGAYPPSLCAWCKADLGWLQPVQISEPGAYSLCPVQDRPKAFLVGAPWYPSPWGREYLLLEHRARRGHDREQPAGGLLVWHVDAAAFAVGAGNDREGHPWQSGWPGNLRHYAVALVQADGAFHLELGRPADVGDIFTGANPDAIVYDSLSLHPSTLGYGRSTGYFHADFSIENIAKDGEDCIRFEIIETGAPPDSEDGLITSTSSQPTLGNTNQDEEGEDNDNQGDDTPPPPHKNWESQTSTDGEEDTKTAGEAEEGQDTVMSAAARNASFTWFLHCWYASSTLAQTLTGFGCTVWPFSWNSWIITSSLVWKLGYS